MITTSNQPLIAYLLAIKEPFKVDRSNPRRIAFTFLGVDQSLVDDFHSNKLRIDALTYSEALKSYKSILYNGNAHEVTGHSEPIKPIYKYQE